MRLLVPCLVALLLSPVWAQDTDRVWEAVLGKQGKAGKGSEVDRAYAEALATATGLKLRTVDGIDHPAEENPLAGKTIKGQGRSARNDDLYIARFRFETHAEAQAYAEIDPDSRQADPEGLWATEVWGKAARPELLGRVEELSAGGTLPDDIGERLDREGLEVIDSSTAATVPPNRPRFSGVCIQLQGLRLYRLRFDTASAAHAFLFTRGLPGDTGRLMLDQKGKQLLHVAGRALTNEPAFSATVLQAAWNGWHTEDGERRTIMLCPDGDRTKDIEYVGFTTENDKLYQDGAKVLRSSRELARKEGALQGRVNELEWRFLDGKHQNHLIFRNTQGGICAEAFLRPGGMYTAILTSRVRYRAQRKFFFSVLRAIEYRLPSAGKRKLSLLPARD